MKRLLTLIVSVAIAFFLFATMPAFATEMNQGAKIFSINCAGCHPHGGNIIRRGKNLKQRALRKRKLDSVVAIAELVTYGKNNMPAYQERLTQPEIETVSAYVLTQAENGWR